MIIPLQDRFDATAKASFNAGWNAALEEGACIARADLRDANGTCEGSARHADAILGLKVSE